MSIFDVSSVKSAVTATNQNLSSHNIIAVLNNKLLVSKLSLT